MSKILVVDDQAGVCHSFRKILGRRGYEVVSAPDGQTAIEVADREKPDLVFLDVAMPGMDGLTTLKKFKTKEPGLPVIMMTAYSTSEKAITSMKYGAYDYITKPIDNAALLSLVEKAISLRKLSRPVTFEETEDEGSDRIIGKSPLIFDIYKKIGQVAESDVSVLLRGETGTGKELIARAIYQHSKRADRPFLPVNCAAIPETLLESELFGHEKGAFTGADGKKIGKFEQCDTGTMFLDEIGDMPLPLQAKLLRVLEDGRFQRLGGKDVIHADVRIIAATNKNLEALMKNGDFRDDLYWRLNVVSIEIPPLRERKDDVEDLVQYFIKRFNREYGKSIKGVSPELLAEMKGYRWPGNVRELQSVIQRGMVLCMKDFISVEDCEWPSRVKIGEEAADDFKKALSGIADEVLRKGGKDIFKESVLTFEHMMVIKALELTHNNQVAAAKLLGISRNTLREKLAVKPDTTLSEK